MAGINKVIIVGNLGGEFFRTGQFAFSLQHKL
jgi:hypothetical protein